MATKKSSSCNCPTYSIIEFCSKKWAMHILRCIADNKTMRFSEIKEEIPEINSRILSERLGELEEEGLIERVVIDEKPICIEYNITEKGADMRNIFKCFCTFGKKWGKKK
ncbi:MAG: helix-turn-helix transcriptional regulator [Candidatus Peribacter sp.]|nr:helix-turn-helix transcriptional regulator [Candidatus Peribacter sp.]MBT4392536.1 helix-turn-helix transcriptional regulator [Candidatus Peribacter sp.]MBT4601383.1 helix-turn-helix transcriptional regulator [Candidatus Peribacter sp.]MBT5149521.1 helix-turn-helix transcriptional regulator [Candidatus Peribacter sp.]MBT5638073.1 helix-turn-helix transcriptional regulator [Candidatus Peribacter sp.]